ncbi:uncharacterized protein TNIN_12941 [Trichonephila inaurata madagascariensis]|uniref:Uncharacterized protein n=1 Tax=Trichonephila inaurata madagascariensis TaxID=2747483 RepID=A0A8X6YJB2_9ARAC|nr:uncharacterized protein TNIN_12941 [Trichonephila inaurata madagascariensis]
MPPSNFLSNTTGLHRTGRKNYGLLPPLPPRDYGAVSDDEDDSSDDSEPIPYNDKPQQGNGYSHYNKYKGYDQFNHYAPPSYPPFVNNYKGSPYTEIPPMSPDQMMQIMMVLNSMKETEEPEDSGILSKLVKDPKIAAAAFIPLSVAAAAFVPVLMNYLMGGSSTPIVSTVANSKQFRSLDVSSNLDGFFESVVAFSRGVGNDECIQKTICKAALGQSNVRMSELVKKIVSTVSQVVKDDWLNNFRMKHLIDAIKKGKCDNVCNNTGIAPILS